MMPTTLLHRSPPHILFFSNKYLSKPSYAGHHLRCRELSEIKFLCTYSCTSVMKTSMDLSADCFAFHKVCQGWYNIFPNLICPMSYLTSEGKVSQFLEQQSHRLA